MNFTRTLLILIFATVALGSYSASAVEGSRDLANTGGLRGIGGIFSCSAEARGFGKINRVIIVASDESEAKRVYINGIAKGAKKFKPSSNSAGEPQFTIYVKTAETLKRSADFVELTQVSCSLYNEIL